MKNKYSPILFLLFLTSNVFALEVKLVGKDDFEKLNFPNSILLYTKKNDNQLFYRVRFPIDNFKLRKDLFKKAQDLNHINRKTKFKKVKKDEFKAERPSFPFDIEFLAKINTQENCGDADHVYSKSDLLSHKIVFVLKQNLHSYNHFFKSTKSEVTVWKNQEGEFFVDSFGTIKVNKSVPSFVLTKIQSEYETKMVHFQKAMNTLAK